MSPRSSSPRKKGPKGPTAPPDVYVSLLFVSIAALIVGIVMLALGLNEYAWAVAGPGA
jgi:hypothetical protein